MLGGISRSWVIAAVVSGAVATLAGACGGTGEGENSSGATTTNNTSGATGCTPNASVECTCETGEKGAQTCNAAGTGFNICKCGGAPDPGAVCGNGKIEDGEQCDDGNTNADDDCNDKCQSALCGNGKEDLADCIEVDGAPVCPAECGMGQGGAGGGEPTATYCDDMDVVVYAGKVDMVKSLWTYQGDNGVDAGKAMCQALGADTFCDYEQVKIIAQKAANGGEAGFAKIPAGATAWVHRTTAEMVNGSLSQPGPGGRCNNWLYETDHLSDGEYVTFASNGAVTFFLDNDTMYDPGTPGVHVQAGALQCNSVMRDILCCNPCELKK